MARPVPATSIMVPAAAAATLVSNVCLLWHNYPRLSLQLSPRQQSVVSMPAGIIQSVMTVLSSHTDTALNGTRGHWPFTIGVSGSFFRGGQQLHPAKIQSLPAKISSCQGGHVFCHATVPSCPAKLSCQTVLHMEKLEDKWLKNRQKW